MSDKTITIRLEIENKNVKEAFKKIIPSTNGYQIVNSGNHGYCDLLIQEVGDDIKKEFQSVHSLKESGMVKDFFLTSRRTEPEIFLQALRAKEFFTQPVDEDEIKAALLKFKKQLNDVRVNQRMSKQGKIINVFGSKGGVGTTTVAVNLAASLNELDDVQSVALIDMNLIFGEIPLFLDINSFFNWGELAKNISRVDSTYLKSALTKHPSGLHILPSPSGLDSVNWVDPEIIEHLLNLMRNEFDFIVIDNGQSIDDISQKILELSDSVLLVSIQSLPCFINIKRLLETFRDLGLQNEDKIRIIINRYHNNSVVSVKEAEEAIKKKISWHIPNDYDTAITAINQGKVLSLVTKKAEISRNFKKLACTFIEGDGNSKNKGRFWKLRFLGK